MNRSTIRGLCMAALFLLLNGTFDIESFPVAATALTTSASVATQQGCKCADIVLVIDSTNSMVGAINNVKAGIETSIIPAAQAAAPGPEALRMGVVTFKDNVTVNQPLTTSIKPDVTSAVSAITAGGGEGTPEASDEALKYVVNGVSSCPVTQPKGPLGAFRNECFKIIVLVTDAPPGGCDSIYIDNDPTPNNNDDINALGVASNAATKNIIISSILVAGLPYNSTKYPGGVQQTLMNMYATITGGQFRSVPASGAETSTNIGKFIVDKIPPMISCPGNITRPTDPGKCSAMVNYTLTSGDNCPGVTVSCSPQSGAVFPKGTTNVTCMATDTSNNTTSCSFTVTVADTEKPVLNCPVNVTQPTDPGQCSAVVNYSVPVTDNCPGARVTCSPASGSTFQKGSTTVNCLAADAASNIASCSFTVTVVDTEKPKTVCPNDVTTTSCGGTTIITFPDPAATDNCPGVTTSCVPPSNFAFAPGVTVVTCTATDTTGNTSSCSFKVSIDVKTCDTICFYSPQYYLLHLNDLPRGQVLIGGVNYNVPVSTNDRSDIKMALQGNALGYGTLTELQQLNKEFVAAQLSAEGAAGDGSARMFTVFESPLHAWGLNLVPVPLSNGFTITRDTLLKELFAQARSCIFDNRKPDMVLLAGVLDLLNGNDLLSNCDPLRPKPDLAPMKPGEESNFCAFSDTTLRVVIKNQGDAVASATITAVMLGDTMTNVPTPMLLPNQSVDLKVMIPIGGKMPVTIKIVADANNTLGERSKLNNVITTSCP